MRRERVPEGVRMDVPLGRGVPGPDAEAAADVGGREPPAGLGEEQRRIAGGALERRAAALEVDVDRRQRLLADGHEPRLGSLALDPDLLRVEVDRRLVEVDELLGSEAAGVRELE